jgi:hypothetical protein
MCLPRNKISAEQEPALLVGTQSWYSRDEALPGFVAQRCLCNEEGAGFAGDKMGRSIFVLGYQHCCRGQAERGIGDKEENVRKRIQHCSARLFASDWFVLQEWCIRLLFQRGVKGSDRDDQPGSFLKSCQNGSLVVPELLLTMRVLGKVFQLSLTPSRSSTSLH